MMGDEQRGWAWTRALQGLPANELHLCGDASALPLVSHPAAAWGPSVSTSACGAAQWRGRLLGAVSGQGPAPGGSEFQKGCLLSLGGSDHLTWMQPGRRCPMGVAAAVLISRGGPGVIMHVLQMFT